MSLAKFENIEIDYITLENITQENEFMKTSVNLSNEITKNLYAILAIKEDGKVKDSLCLDRNMAIIYAHMLRATKLFRSYMQLVCFKRHDAANILFRSIFETLINMKYLILHNVQGLFEDFVKYSLITEKKLYNKVKERVDKKGIKEPIDERMMKSIKYSFEMSDCPMDNIELDYTKNKWGKLLLRKKHDDIYSQEAYEYMFSGGNHAVHGNWESLLRSELKYDKEKKKFSPNYYFKEPRPQTVLAAMIILCEASIDY